MYRKDYLLAKSDGVSDCVSWLKKKIQSQKLEVEKAKLEYRQMGGFDDCGDFYSRLLIEAETELATLISVKKSLEKYSKKMRHESSESVRSETYE